MKVGNFVQLIVDTQDVLSFFTTVKTKEQMVSALERIKHTDAATFLDTIVSLTNSFANLTEDDLETPTPDDIDELLTGETAPEDENPIAETTAAERLGIAETEKA